MGTVDLPDESSRGGLLLMVLAVASQTAGTIVRGRVFVRDGGTDAAGWFAIKRANLVREGRIMVVSAAVSGAVVTGAGVTAWLSSTGSSAPGRGGDVAVEARLQCPPWSGSLSPQVAKYWPTLALG